VALPEQAAREGAREARGAPQEQPEPQEWAAAGEVQTARAEQAAGHRERAARAGLPELRLERQERAAQAVQHQRVPSVRAAQPPG
jgi:hypothetical protein